VNIKTHLLQKTDEHSDFEVRVNGKRQGVIRGFGVFPKFQNWGVPSKNVLDDKYRTNDQKAAIEECCRRNGRVLKKAKK
jgi:hypothetical protein